MIEKDRRGVRGASNLKLVLISAGREQLFVRRTRQINVCAETHTILRVLEISPNEKAQAFHEHRLLLPSVITHFNVVGTDEGYTKLQTFGMCNGMPFSDFSGEFRVLMPTATGNVVGF